jgi:hypothetical protein
MAYSVLRRTRKETGKEACQQPVYLPQRQGFKAKMDGPFLGFCPVKFQEGKRILTFPPVFFIMNAETGKQVAYG